MKKYNFIKPLLVGLMLVSSCNDDILYKNNPNELSTETFFETSEQLESAVSAVYAGLQTRNLYGREFFFLHDMLSDENIPNNSGLEAPRAAALSYNFDAGNFLIVEVWQGLYRVIHRANVVIANAQRVPDNQITAQLRNRLEAEARFLRAWAYFELVSLWGPVPLYTEPVTVPQGNPRAPEEEIYALIWEDLEFAETNLWLKSEYASDDLGRVTKGAAQSLKGKIHLWRAEYGQAKTEFQKVISSGNYSLVPRYLDNFQEENENNAESIFEVQLSTQHGYGNPWSSDGNGVDEVTFRGQEYTPTTGWANVFPSPSQRNVYEANDPRVGYNFYKTGDPFNNGANTMTVNFPNSDTGWRKYSNAYKQPTEDQISGINFRVIRYADVLLMMAEALNEDGAGNQAAAIALVNQVRARADVNMPALSAGSQAATRLIIQQERQRELPSEQVRNRDIRRWRRHGLLGPEPISNYQANKHGLLPIPAPEIANNAAISEDDQNPNY